MSVNFNRPEYVSNYASWQLVNDVVTGEESVKSGRELYLPNPSTQDDADKLYVKYKQRASLLNATGRTLKALLGLAFSKKPELINPTALDFAVNDIDGAGVGLNQQAQMTLSRVLTNGRAGLLTDYPAVTATSKADQDSGDIRPTITRYDAANIKNWRTEQVGGAHKLSLVVLEESHIERVDDFEFEVKEQLRALRLVDNVYVQEVYRKNGESFELIESIQPRKGNGSSWNEIPFTFVGAVNNDSTPDKPPLLDLATLNIKHYQVGADWYNALHWAGQPQPTITGLTEQWRDWLDEKGFVVGSMSVLPLPENADYKIVAITADTALQKELESLKEGMKELGARLLTPNSAVKTAAETRSNDKVSHSELSLAAENVSSAYEQSLNWMAEFHNVSGEISYEINQDYLDHSIDAQMLTALVGAWQSGSIPETDLWMNLRKKGVINPEKTDEEIKEELDAATAGLNLDGN